MTGTLELGPPGQYPVQAISLAGIVWPGSARIISGSLAVWQSGTKLYEIYRWFLMTTQREGEERRERQLNVCVGDMQGWPGLNTNIPAVTTTNTITLQLFLTASNC